MEVFEIEKIHGIGIDTSSHANRLRPYLICTKIPGNSLRFQRNLLTHSQRLTLARDLGTFLGQFNSIQIQSTLACFQPDYFEKFIKNQIENCKELHRSRGTLPKHLVEDISSFIPKDPLQFIQDLKEVATFGLVHGDVHEDHVFISDEGKLNGIIDFDDCCYGSPLYELPGILYFPLAENSALIFSSFQYNKELLNAFLETFKLKQTSSSNFARMCLTLCLLHKYDIFHVEGYEIDFESIPSLDELARFLFLLE